MYTGPSKVLTGKPSLTLIAACRLVTATGAHCFTFHNFISYDLERRHHNNLHFDLFLQLIVSLEPPHSSVYFYVPYAIRYLAYHFIVKLPMSFFTPPPSARKSIIKSFKPTKRLKYYEDIYGTINEDEEFDRFPDECETESDSDEEEPKREVAGSNAGFFKKYAGQKRKKASPEQAGMESSLQLRM